MNLKTFLLFSTLVLSPIVLPQTVQAQSSNSVGNADKYKADFGLRYKTNFDLRMNFYEKHCKWNTFTYQRLKYRVCAMEDIIMAVENVEAPGTDTGPAFYRYNYGGMNTFAFRETDSDTVVIIERDRLVAEVPTAYSTKTKVITQFTSEQRKRLTDRAVSAQKRLESIAAKVRRSASATR